MAAAHFLAPLLREPSLAPGLFVRDRDHPVALYLETAFDSASRKRGLLGRHEVPHLHALVIARCSLIHTFGMSVVIDAIFAARDGRVVKLSRGLKPARISGALRAFAVIEMAAGSIDRAGLTVGDVLEVRSPGVAGRGLSQPSSLVDSPS